MDGRQSQGRVLLIAYFFGDAGTGAFRWNEMVRHLAASGWEFDVITHATRARIGGGAATEVPGVRVVPVAEPRWLVRAATAPVEWVGWVKRALFHPRRPPPAAPPVTREQVRERWPEVTLSGGQRLIQGTQSLARLAAELLWSRRAAAAAARLLRRGTYRAVIVSTPPHAAQLAGARLARRFSIPYLADYRDPWDFGVHPTGYGIPHRAQRRLGQRLERATMERARLVICNTENAREAVTHLYGLNGRTVAIPNGYDALPSASRPDRDRFRVVYAGALHPYHDVRALLGACARLRSRLGPARDRLLLEFMGGGAKFRGVPVPQLALRYGLGDCVLAHERGDREEALRLQQSAAVLVVFDHFHGLSVPTKFYDFAQLYGSPLAIGSPNGALARTAGRVGVRVYDPPDADGLDAALDAAYRQWSEYCYDTPTDPEGIFDRRRQSARLGEILAGLAGPAARPNA